MKDWYTEEVMRTWDNSRPKLDRIMHAALGLVGEATEFVKSGKEDDEGGDALFYFYALSSEVRHDVNEAVWTDSVGSSEHWDKALLIAVGAVSELIKKMIFHSADVRETLPLALCRVQYVLDFCLQSPIEEIKQLNKSKLRKRYPEGFSLTKRCDSCGGEIDEHYTSNKCMKCDMGTEANDGKA